MLELNAIFHRKEINLDSVRCVVEKVIPLTGPRFDTFAAGMLRDYDFISENVDLMRQDSYGVMHCLLVTGAEREDGILVQSEGANYARYAALVPHVHSIIAAQSRSPALALLEHKLSAFVDYLAGEYAEQLDHDSRASVYLAGHARDFHIEMEGNGTLWDTVVGMLDERMAGYDLGMEIDNGDLILTPNDPEMGMGMQDLD